MPHELLLELPFNRKSLLFYQDVENIHYEVFAVLLQNKFQSIKLISAKFRSYFHCSLLI